LATQRQRGLGALEKHLKGRGKEYGIFSNGGLRTQKKTTPHKKQRTLHLPHCSTECTKNKVSDNLNIVRAKKEGNLKERDDLTRRGGASNGLGKKQTRANGHA